MKTAAILNELINESFSVAQWLVTGHWIGKWKCPSVESRRPEFGDKPPAYESSARTEMESKKYTPCQWWFRPGEQNRPK